MKRHRDVMSDPFEAESAAPPEESDPMSGLSNLADCMLVLACGLMIALVVHWNIDMTPHYEHVEETGEMKVVEGNPELAIENENATADDENVFENMGTLYRDPRTGKLYYLRTD